MLRAWLLAAVVGLFGGTGTAQEFVPPKPPVAGCISGIDVDEQGNVHEYGVACTVIIPGIASD